MILALFYYVVTLVINPPLYDTVKYGEITTWDHGQGLVIRQERAYPTSEYYGKVDFFVSKGQEVKEDELLAIVYKEGYDSKLIVELYNIKQKIWDYQNKNLVQEIMDNDFEKIENNINTILYTIQYNIQKDEIHSMGIYENQLRGLLDRKKEILDKKDSTSKYLEQLYSQEKEIENKLEEWKIEIKAPESGFISFELDGLENIISPKDIDYLTVEQFLSLRDHKPLVLDTENHLLEIPLFKIVSSNKWYIVSLIPHKNIFYEQGDTLSLKLLGLSEEIINAQVYKVDYIDDSTLVVLEMVDSIESVLEVRNIHIEIGIKAEGLMIPREAIIYKNNKTGVKIDHNGDIKYIEVKVKALDDDWAIIEKAKDNDIIEVNDIVIIE